MGSGEHGFDGVAHLPFAAQQTHGRVLIEWRTWVLPLASSKGRSDKCAVWSGQLGEPCTDAQVQRV